jgi:hypothetical protein
MTFNKLDNATKWWIVGIVSGVIGLGVGVTAAKNGVFDEDVSTNSNDSTNTASGLTKRRRKHHNKSNKKRK